MKLYLLALSGNVRKVSGEGDLPSVSQMFWVIGHGRGTSNSEG